MGAVSAFGVGVAALWEGVISGTVAIRPVERIDTSAYAAHAAGEITDAVSPAHSHATPGGPREPTIEFALRAAEEAWMEAGLRLDQVPAERWAVVMGTSVGGLVTGERWFASRLAGRHDVPAAQLLWVSPHAPAEALAAAFGLGGPVASICTACASSTNAIGLAADIIRSGRADAALAGGTDSLSATLFAGFNSLEALSAKPAAPFSRNRDGLSLGEGAGVLLLVRADLAERFGLRPLVDIAGYGISSDGYHPTAPQPDGDGAARAIREALASAGTTPERVCYVNAHGTGTAKNDSSESAAIHAAFGEHARLLAVSGTKSMTGHALGAAGAIEAIITARAVQEGIVPPTANFDVADPDCDLDVIPNQSRALAVDVAISNSFGFGGANACLVLTAPGALPEPPVPAPRRALITGLSTLLGAGRDPDDVWSAFIAGTPNLRFEGGARLGTFKVDPWPLLIGRETRRMDRISVIAVVASGLALADSGIEIDPGNRDRVGVVYSTGAGPVESLEMFVQPLLEDGPTAANPAVFPHTVYNAAGGYVAMHLGTVGASSTVTTGHAAGGTAICYAIDLITLGRADAVIAVCADAVTPLLLEAYRGLGLVGAPGADLGLTDAGVAVVVESELSAAARRHAAYAELLGYGMTFARPDAGGEGGESAGIEAAMRTAVARAGLEPAQVAVVWSSACGHRRTDAAEAAAIRRVFGAGKVTVAPKLVLGEPIGAGAGLGVALAVQSWAHPEAGLPSGPALVNSCSLTGTCVSLLLAPPRETPG
jgi:3-oxoacyl-[acyl-carrier-protein] synthase II